MSAPVAPGPRPGRALQACQFVLAIRSVGISRLISHEQPAQALGDVQTRRINLLVELFQ
jgi:hypothetical protein